MKYITWIVVIAVLVWIGWAIAHKAPKAEAGPIMIGSILPLTGDAATLGEPGRNIISMAVDEINAAGGINGRMLQIISEDGKCDGTSASSAAQKLVNVDKVQAILGGFCSSESLAAEPIATAGKVLLFSPGSSSPDLTGKSHFFARNYPSDASQGSVLAQVAYASGLRKIAFIQEQKDYSLGVFKAFESTFTAAGGTVVKEEFATDATDFRTILSKLKAQNPDALFIDPQSPPPADRILKQIQDMGWKPKIYLNDAVAGEKSLITKYATLLEGAMTAEYGVDPTNPKFAALSAAYKAKYNVDLPWQSYAQSEYDSMYILADGIRAVGYNGTKLADWIHTVKDWEGAAGKVTIGENGDVVGGHRAEVIKGGMITPYGQ